MPKTRRKKSTAQLALPLSSNAGFSALAAPLLYHFPPSRISDLVIHYRDTAFHVHKLVLCCHSSYFRAYIEQLTADQRAYPAGRM